MDILEVFSALVAPFIFGRMLLTMATSLRGDEGHLCCLRKAMILNLILLEIEVVLCAIYTIESAAIGSSFLSDTWPSLILRKLTCPTLLEGYPIMWDMAVLLLSIAAFHISVRQCACTNGTPVPGGCRRRG